MQIEDLRIYVAGAEPYSTIQGAINSAVLATPGAAVVIPANYSKTDTFTNPSNVPVLDLRGSATSTGFNIPGPFSGITALSATSLAATGKVSGSNFNGVIRAVGAAVAAPITGATGGVFVTTLNVPQSAAEQTPFMVRACGYVSLDAGTYTATVQPLLYASTTAGFTAAVGNAVYSTAAINVTQSSASAKVVPWMTQVIMWGDSVSGLTLGTKYGGMNNGALQIQSPVTAIDNPPTSVNFAAAVPLQFASGVTLSNAAATSIVNLGSLNLEI